MQLPCVCGGVDTTGERTGDVIGNIVVVTSVANDDVDDGGVIGGVEFTV